jgi:hypothetical protein
MTDEATSPLRRRMIEARVGWVEPSRNPSCFVSGERLMGFAALYPSYGLVQHSPGRFAACHLLDGDQAQAAA